MLLFSFKVSFLPVTSMQNSCLAATHANSFPGAELFPPAICPPVELRLFRQSCSCLRGLPWHIHREPTGETVEISRLVSVQPGTSAWRDLKHANTPAPASPWSSPAAFAIEHVLIRQRLLAWVQHRSDGALLRLVSKPSAAQSVLFSFPQHTPFCQALKARAESVPTARNVGIPCVLVLHIWKEAAWAIEL